MDLMRGYQQHVFSLIFLVLLPFAAAFSEIEEINDPLESVNRGIFSFNDTIDVNLLEPVARGYDSVMPQSIRTGVGNFFENLNYPQYLVSDLVQGKIGQVGLHTGRFLINSTIGLVGLIDVAKEFGLERHVEDFGIALAYHGMPSGPYIVLPIIGPSNLRDGFGMIVDTALNPLTWLTYTELSAGAQWGIQLGARGITLVHTRAGLIQAIETAKESSLDYYLFVQGAYYQHRHGLVTDGKDDDEDDDNYNDE